MNYCPKCIKILDGNYDACPICGYTDKSVFDTYNNDNSSFEGSAFDILDDLEALSNDRNNQTDIYSIKEYAEENPHICQNDILENSIDNQVNTQSSTKPIQSINNNESSNSAASNAMAKNNQIKVKPNNTQNTQSAKSVQNIKNIQSNNYNHKVHTPLQEQPLQNNNGSGNIILIVLMFIFAFSSPFISIILSIIYKSKNKNSIIPIITIIISVFLLIFRRLFFYF